MYWVPNIWTFGQLIEKLNKHDLINISVVRNSDFKNFKLFEDKYYKVITSGKLLTGHIFTVEDSNPAMTIINQDRLGTALPHKQSLKLPLLDRTAKETRIQELLLLPGLEKIGELGIPAIKQIKLYKKWREIVPMEYHNEMCPKPSVDILEKFTAEQKTKNQAKQAAAKKRTEQHPLSPALLLTDGNDNGNNNDNTNIWQQLQ